MGIEYSGPALGEWCTPLATRTGVYISVRKRYLFPPPSENYIFFPSHGTLFFNSHRGLFSLILPYFAFILPFYFPFSHLLSPFFIFSLSSFFFYIFPPFSLHIFIFFPPNDIGWYPPPGGIFQYIDPCTRMQWFLTICHIFGDSYTCGLNLVLGLENIFCFTTAILSGFLNFNPNQIL